MNVGKSIGYLLFAGSLSLALGCQPGEVVTKGGGEPETVVTGGPDPFVSAPIPPSIIVDCKNVTAPPVIYICELDGQPIACEQGIVNLPSVSDGQHVLNIFATDAEGNICPPSTVVWYTDTTAPAVSITGAPPVTTQQTGAQIEFSGFDSGSGIAGYKCSMDGSAFIPCESPFVVTNLSEGVHHFQVIAVDQAGNNSLPATAVWTVGSPNNPPPPNGAQPVITYLGVKSHGNGKDQVIDNYLGQNGTPRFYWDSNIDDLYYSIKVMKGQSTVCTLNNTTAELDNGMLARSLTNCSLSDGKIYQVWITGTDGQGQSGMDTAQFLVDLTAPKITLTRKDKNNKDNEAEVQVKVEETGSGLASLKCTLESQSQPAKQIACSNNGIVSLKNLLGGEYRLTAVAKDRAGNVSQKSIEFEIKVKDCKKHQWKGKGLGHYKNHYDCHCNNNKYH